MGMKNFMTIQEAKERGLWQIYVLLEKDRRIRESLGMLSLQEAISNSLDGYGKRGRPPTNTKL